MGETGWVFGKNMEKLAGSLGKTASVLVKTGAGFLEIGSVLDWLGTKLKSHCFER